MHNRRSAKAAQPRQRIEPPDPGPDTVGTHGVRALLVDADLEEVGPQLDPVVDEEADGNQRPHRREQRQVPELDRHLRDVVLDVVGRQARLLLHIAQECFRFRFRFLLLLLLLVAQVVVWRP